MNSAGAGGMDGMLDRLLRGARVWIWVLAVALGGSLSLLTGVRWFPPLAQAIPAWLILWFDLRRGRPEAGVRHMLVWAVITSAGVIALTLLCPARAERAVFHGGAYRDEMLHYIRTGIGAEGSPAQFLPQHALHYASTLALSFLTAGWAGLVLGTVLLNYMNFYVGSLALVSQSRTTALLFGWPIWSLFRVAGFIVGAIAAAQFLLGRVLKRAPWDAGRVRRMMLWSLGLVLADVGVKALLAPWWRRLLLRALGQ